MHCCGTVFHDDDVWWLQIADEAHGVKSTERSRFRRLSKLRSAHKLLLTGTPVQNNLSELFAMLRFAMPDVFYEDDEVYVVIVCRAETCCTETLHGMQAI